MTKPAPAAAYDGHGTLTVLQSWAEAQQWLYDRKHTGPVIVHFAQGHPQEVELPNPSTRIRLRRRER